MLSFKEAVITCLKIKPLNFQDRAPRSEYWWFVLFLFGFGIIVNMLGLIPFLGALLVFVWGIVSFITSLSATVRRLHDINRTGLWIIAPYAIMLVAGIIAVSGLFDVALVVTILAGVSWIAMLVFLVLPGTIGPNRFGPDPLSAEVKAIGNAIPGQADFGGQNPFANGQNPFGQNNDQQ